MNGQNRKDIKPGLQVDIVTKQDQRSERKTRGIVKAILTNSSHHPTGLRCVLRPARLAGCKRLSSEAEIFPLLFYCPCPTIPAKSDSL
jgi:uncharacterized repeat protein (TIGR03833 family)